jgi:hypothetical protein
MTRVWRKGVVILGLLGVLAFFTPSTLGTAPAIAATKSDDGPPPVVRFIDLGPLSAAILNRNRVRGLVTVQITIEILDPETAPEVQAKIPRVKAAWLNVYQRHIGRLSSLSERLDLEVMIGDMRQASDIVIGKGAIRPLIQNVQYSR